MMHARGSLHRSASNIIRTGIVIRVLILAPLTDSFGHSYQLRVPPLRLVTAANMIGLNRVRKLRLRTQEKKS